MNVFLIGGGWSDELAPELYGGFIAAAAATAAVRAAGGTAPGSPAARPRVLLVLMGTDEESLAYHERYLEKLGLVGGHDLEVVRVPEGDPIDPTAVARLDHVDGLFVGGCPTPEYHASLETAYGRIRARVADGMAYAGFSAGAAIAGSHAVIGGWRVDGTPVCPRTATRSSTPSPWSRASACSTAPSTSTPPSGATSHVSSPSSRRVSHPTASPSTRTRSSVLTVRCAAPAGCGTPTARGWRVIPARWS